jgi:hypothetical protein
MFFLSMSGSLASNSANAACTPNADEVAVYQHSSYRGICSVLGVGDYNNSAQLRMKNDSVSSIRVGGNAQIKACRHAKSNTVTGGLKWFDDPQSCQTFVQDIVNLNDTRLGNDTISSASVSPRPLEGGFLSPAGSCSPGPDDVAVYQFKNLKGNCRILPIGSYSNSSQTNFKNDSISSIQIDPTSSVHILVCQHKNYSGRCETIARTDIDLSDNQVGDNSITSVKVIRK